MPLPPLPLPLPLPLSLHTVVQILVAIPTTKMEAVNRFHIPIRNLEKIVSILTSLTLVFPDFSILMRFVWTECDLF